MILFKRLEMLLLKLYLFIRENPKFILATIFPIVYSTIEQHHQEYLYAAQWLLRDEEGFDAWTQGQLLQQAQQLLTETVEVEHPEGVFRSTVMWKEDAEAVLEVMPMPDDYSSGEELNAQELNPENKINMK